MTQVFTIVSCNYLAEARVLMDSVREFLPEAGRTVFFIDDWTGKFDPAAEDFECVAARTTSLPRYRHYAFAYSPGELCFALKPYCARYLFGRDAGARSLVYVDSDMLFLSGPDALLELLQRHPIVLSPHKLKAAEGTEHFNIVRAGAFNAGFFALSRGAEADDFTAWWGRQMTEPTNLAQDWFFDQGWLDLVPSYFPATAILRDPGYNVAFWNLGERRVEGGGRRSEVGGRRAECGGGIQGTGDGGQETGIGGGRRAESGWLMAEGGERMAEGGGRGAGGAKWRVVFGGEEYALVLFHFSMFDHRYPDRISGEIDYSRGGPNADLDALIAEYVGRLKARGLEDCHRWPYDHGAFADGKPVTKEHREFFKKRFFHGLAESADPFDPAMGPRGLGSLYNVDHPVARFVRRLKGSGGFVSG